MLACDVVHRPPNWIERVVFVTAGWACTYHLLNRLDLEQISPKLTPLGRFLITGLIGWMMYVGLWRYVGNLTVLLPRAQLIEPPFSYVLSLADFVNMLALLLIVYRQLGKGGGTPGKWVPRHAFSEKQDSG